MNRLGALVSVLCATAAGCSLLVDPDDEPVRCAPSVPGACPAGEECRADGVCAPSGFDGGPGYDGPVPDGCDVERCNQIDDDCDGNIDEGHDQDGDLFTWCGDGVDMASRDCDDNDANVLPGGTEVCDLADNDCDGMTDESPTSICASGEECSSGRCFATADCRLPGRMCTGGQICDDSTTVATCITPGCVPADCASPLVCDPVSGDCVTPLPFGSECTRDVDCTTDLCASRTLIGLSTVPARMCTQACCTDNDCPTDAICFAGGLGPKLCVPLTATSLPGIGTGGAGAACTTGVECRSARCLSDATCVAQCGNDAQCETGICQPRTVSSVETPICRAPIGSQGFAAPCIFNNDCATGMCIGGFPGQCTRLCKSSGDCGPNYCTYISRGGQWFSACLGRPHGGTGATGTECMSSDECGDRVCHESRCADICCSNTDCPGPSDECKPIPVGSHYELHCVP